MEEVSDAIDEGMCNIPTSSIEHPYLQSVWCHRQSTSSRARLHLELGMRHLHLTERKTSPSFVNTKRLVTASRTFTRSSMVSTGIGFLRAGCSSRFPPQSSEKQTMEFNIQIRANFKKTVRARMGECSIVAVWLDAPELTVSQVFGMRWRCSTPLSTTLIRMYVPLDLPAIF